MKRIFAVLLALCMALSMAACGAEQETAQEQTKETATESEVQPSAETLETSADGEALSAAFPAVGDKIAGFTVTDVSEFPLIGADIALFEHDKTGAGLMYIANSDTNRVFELSFLTRAVDNSGLPHVFEHSTLDGSEKYPSKSLFFNLSYQTYNTFMNAYTMPLMTNYPVASLSEAQLLKYADYYTDSCLHPMILQDESIFLEEAWRYRLADMDSPLTIEGTVYSEMQGALDLNSVANNNMYRTTFPGSQIGNESGGEPDSIINMTWESLKNYHELYYHPSNCMAYLYGAFEDYAAFLRLLDEAFSPYEKREFSFDDPDYEPLKSSVQVELPFPMEAGSDTENRSVVYYSFLCPGLKNDAQEELVLNTLTDLLTPSSSPLMQSLKNALPSGQFGAYIETQGPDDAIVFYGANLNREDAETFKQTIDEGLATIVEEGFSRDYVDGLMASLSLSMKLLGETSRGTDVIDSIAFSYVTSGNPYSFMDYVEALNAMDEWNARGLYTEAVKKWLLGENALTALSVTYPEPGAREELDAKEAERLAGVKAAMSEEELQAIIERSNAEEEPDDASALVAQLQAVTVDSLPEELRRYDMQDETGADGVRRLSAEADVDGVGQTVLLLDAAGLKQEQIHYFALYTALLGEMETSAHSVEELGVLATRYLYNGEIRLSLMNGEADDYHPYLRCGWIAADEDLQTGYDLINELLFDTQFDDTETLQGMISRTKASLKSSINSNPYSVMLYRCFGASSGLYAYYSYFNYLDYYAFLEQLEQQAQDDPAAVIEQLRAVQTYFHNAANAISLYAGSAEGVKANRTAADAFLAALDNSPVEPVTYAFEKPAQREALIVDSSVQYNGLVADFASMGLADYSGDLDAVTSLMADLYLYPKLRDQYGAYGVFNAASEDVGVYVCSYRDPNIRESFAVYDALPAFLAELDVDQETLDGYILSSYSSYAIPEGELSGAISTLLNVVDGSPADLNLRYMRELKTLTPEKLRSYVEAYEKLMAEGLRFTAGGAAAIIANADLYDEILNPFGALDDPSELSFSDLTEEHPCYEDTLGLFEEGLLLPRGEELFGVDEPATLGDLAGALYVLLDGSASAQEEAIAFFAEYSIVPADGKADDPLTGKDAENILRSFTEAVQMNFQADENAGKAVLTRGELAARFVQYLRDLGLWIDDE